ncbi:MAG: hypothetical protein DMG21_14245 [Acidobacteria bacterium]|nr:MAG: hypothetical protein DMG21_14245 [Acidobacteriota bacterium]
MLLGIWLGGTVFMFFVAGASFATVERILRNPTPGLAQAAKPLEAGETRPLFRYFAAELNRRVFAAYGWGQVVVGTILLWFLSRQSPLDAVSLALAGALLSIAVILGLVVTPQMSELGRALDFVSRNPPPPGLAHFQSLHRTYTTLDTTKFVLGIALLTRWLFTR